MLHIDRTQGFSLDNLPFGIFAKGNEPSRVGVALGTYVIDMPVLAATGAFDDLLFDKTVFDKPYLNHYIALGKTVHQGVRQRLQEIFATTQLNEQSLSSKALVPLSEVQLYMPVKVGNYTDFYSSEQHARNVGMMFRDPENALLPNWKHLPVAYHGRASSIVVSGTDFHRPHGQVFDKDTQTPLLAPTQCLDFELELATIIGKSNSLGSCVSTAEAEEYVFGYQLFNDWSAREIQRWEYVPLGPFLAKNFFSSVSPWIITAEALAPFRVTAPIQNPTVLPYLQQDNRQNFDIQLSVTIETQSGQSLCISQTNSKHLYWTVAQQIAHHTINGCNLQVGDMLASGTISGDTPGSFGSMLELTWGGKNPITLPDGSTRKFVEDFDTVIIRGFAGKDDMCVSLGEIRTTVLPAQGFVK